MAQQAQGAPSVVMNQGGSRQQVPLRDYLNGRIAPFLKKAMTQSLDVEAEYPLQWLGECLINQSILYEGNPDRTNIRERFLYNFDTPTPMQAETQKQPELQAEPGINGTAPSAIPEPDIPSSVPPEQPQLLPNGESERMEEESKDKPEAEAEAEVPVQDTEMAGTS